MNQDRGDPKKFWRSINSLTGFGKNKRKNSLSEIINAEGTSLKRLDAANFMIEFCTNAGPKLASNFADCWTDNDFNIPCSSYFSFDFITEQPVVKLVKEIKISKSSATGSLSSRLSKDAFQVRVYELTDIFNTCLDTGVFPASWGIGEITPIPKVNIHSKKPEDWRPITQIKLPGKLLERCIHSQLYVYFDEYFLDSQQHGFRPKRSTSTAVFEMLKHSYKSWNDRMYHTCVFIDFSRAFDCIDHNILLSKLKLYGLDEKALLFISSYFNNRYQSTVIDGNKSNTRKVTYGTAQGSILGLLIFIIYVNDLFNEVIISDNIIMYADDTLLKSQAKTRIESVSLCQDMLDKIIDWCDKNKLTVNIEKTKCMFINSGNEDYDSKLYIKGTALDNVKCFEYLGMNIDNRLSMNKHVESMIKKARCKLGLLYKIRKFISSETALLLYKVMIRPHMEYGDFVVESSNQIYIDKLEKMQEKGLRLAEFQPPEKKRDVNFEK